MLNANTGLSNSVKQTVDRVKRSNQRKINYFSLDRNCVSFIIVKYWGYGGNSSLLSANTVLWNRVKQTVVRAERSDQPKINYFALDHKCVLFIIVKYRG